MTADLPFQSEQPVTRPPLRYHGGKWCLAPWIIEHFPDSHRVYCEPFGGGASVLLRKPRSPVEIYNEIDDEVVNLFQILRDPEAADRLIKSIWLTPFSRGEYDNAFELTFDPIERARRLVIRSFFGFSTTSINPHNRSNGFRWMASKPYAVEFAALPDSLQAVIARFRGVTVLRDDALEVIPRQDSIETLFFVDPPYLIHTRTSKDKPYRFEMCEHDHRQLAHILNRVKGKVVLCGYPSGLYNQELYSDWRIVQTRSYASGQKGRSQRTEVLWLNF
jgi:DNA adenine methylase